MSNFVVLSSSRGTTFQAVLDAMTSGELTAKCLGLVADQTDRGCVAKAEAAGLPIKIVEKTEGESREDYDKRLHEAILELGGSPKNTFIAALGWMFILDPDFVNTWRQRIVNVHPALLPQFPGGHAIADALAVGVHETGMTIHYIDEGIDTGEVILQKACPVQPDDTEETLKLRVQELEKEWYPKVLQDLCK